MQEKRLSPYRQLQRMEETARQREAVEREEQGRWQVR